MSSTHFHDLEESLALAIKALQSNHNELVNRTLEFNFGDCVLDLCKSINKNSNSQEDLIKLLDGIIRTRRHHASAIKVTIVENDK